MQFEYGKWEDNFVLNHREFGFSIVAENGYWWLTIDLWKWWFSITLKKGYGHEQSKYN
jgi:hypothetical protein